MTIEIRGGDLGLTPALVEYVHRAMRFAVGRLGHHVRVVVVRLGDTNGPRGGVDKTCHVLARLRHGGVRIEEVDRDLYVAVDRAAERLGRAAARAIERSREVAA